MSGDVEKLPKWAQQRIDTLTKSVEYWKAKTNAGPEDSDTFAAIGPAIGLDDCKPLGQGAGIRFLLGVRSRDGRQAVEIDARISDDRESVEIRTVHGQLAVRPLSGNMVRIEEARP